MLVNKWRGDMNKRITLMTSAALTVLIGVTGANAESHRRAPDATYGQQDRGTAIDTQATGVMAYAPGAPEPIAAV